VSSGSPTPAEFGRPQSGSYRAHQQPGPAPPSARLALSQRPSGAPQRCAIARCGRFRPADHSSWSARPIRRECGLLLAGTRPQHAGAPVRPWAGIAPRHAAKSRVFAGELSKLPDPGSPPLPLPPGAGNIKTKIRGIGNATADESSANQQRGPEQPPRRLDSAHRSRKPRRGRNGLTSCQTRVPAQLNHHRRSSVRRSTSSVKNDDTLNHMKQRISRETERPDLSGSLPVRARPRHPCGHPWLSKPVAANPQTQERTTRRRQRRSMPWKLPRRTARAKGPGPEIADSCPRAILTVQELADRLGCGVSSGDHSSHCSSKASVATVTQTLDLSTITNGLRSSSECRSWKTTSRRARQKTVEMIEEKATSAL